jgi:hypothetical protein
MDKTHTSQQLSNGNKHAIQYECHFNTELMASIQLLSKEA